MKIPLLVDVGMWVMLITVAWLTIRDIMENIRIRREFERAKANGRIVYSFKPSKNKWKKIKMERLKNDKNR